MPHAPYLGVRLLLRGRLDSQSFAPYAITVITGRSQRWRIEEAFKRLKQRLHLECVSGLTQQALEVDVAAKLLADNIAALLCLAVAETGDFMTRKKQCNRT